MLLNAGQGPQAAGQTPLAACPCQCIPVTHRAKIATNRPFAYQHIWLVQELESPAPPLTTNQGQPLQCTAAGAGGQQSNRQDLQAPFACSSGLAVAKLFRAG